MVRRTRAESQGYNRARILAAARAEFLERGYRETRIDQIAERAELTRGAVYSNFAGKRALYFAVLAEDVRTAPAPGYAPTATTVAAVLGDVARAWLARLPLATDDEHSAARLGRDLLPEVLADPRTSLPFAQLTSLSAILLGLALEGIAPGARRRVRTAEAALTTLHGAGQLAAAAPGFVDPFAVAAACEHLAGLDHGDDWPPPHLPFVPLARPVDERWPAPTATDALRDEPVDLHGVVAVLGLHRLAAVEEAVRAAPPSVPVTAVLVSGDPAELSALAQVVLGELRLCLRAAVPAAVWPRLRVVHDDAGTLAAAAGLPSVSDATQHAVLVRDGRVVARADGYGACHAAAVAATR